jgi:hypothetical protein
VRDQACQVTVFVEHYTVGPGVAAAEDLAGAQNREFIVGPGNRKCEAFMVVVSVYERGAGLGLMVSV